MTTNDVPTTPPADQTDLPEWLRDQVDRTITDSPAAPVEQKFSPTMVTLLLLAVGLLVVIGYALYQRSQSQPTHGPAPRFSVTTYNTDQIAMPGERLTLDGLKGQPVVLNFWASYCIPCQQEAPMFERIWNEYRDQNVLFLGVNTDEPETDAVNYLYEYRITYPNGPDRGGKMEDDYRITGIPETFVIDRQGKIVEHFLSTPRESELRDAIERALDS